MQPAAVLSKKDIARFQKVVGRLQALANSLNGQVAEIAPPKRPRKRRAKAQPEAQPE